VLKDATGEELSLQAMSEYYAPLKSHLAKRIGDCKF
jgi:hypothetical protein